jgi:hypothetical protein
MRIGVVLATRHDIAVSCLKANIGETENRDVTHRMNAVKSCLSQVNS